MITIRKIYTKEMNDQFIETGVLSDEALIALLDTYRALTKLLSNKIFFPLHADAYMKTFEYCLVDREKEINLTFETPELIIKDVPSLELIDRISSGDEELTLSHEEVITLLNFCSDVLNLTDFDPTYFFLLRFFIAGVSVDATGWLAEMTKGIAQA